MAKAKEEKKDSVEEAKPEAPVEEAKVEPKEEEAKEEKKSAKEAKEMPVKSVGRFQLLSKGETYVIRNSMGQLVAQELKSADEAEKMLSDLNR